MSFDAVVAHTRRNFAYIDRISTEVLRNAIQDIAR